MAKYVIKPLLRFYFFVKLVLTLFSYSAYIKHFASLFNTFSVDRFIQYEIHTMNLYCMTKKNEWEIFTGFCGHTMAAIGQLLISDIKCMLQGAKTVPSDHCGILMLHLNKNRKTLYRYFNRGYKCIRYIFPRSILNHTTMTHGS